MIAAGTVLIRNPAGGSDCSRLDGSDRSPADGADRKKRMPPVHSGRHPEDAADTGAADIPEYAADKDGADNPAGAADRGAAGKLRNFSADSRRGYAVLYQYSNQSMRMTMDNSPSRSEFHVRRFRRECQDPDFRCCGRFGFLDSSMFFQNLSSASLLWIRATASTAHPIGFEWIIMSGLYKINFPISSYY